jgi:hypothetical protein
VPSALPPEAVGFLALVALALLPGVLLVRAPWTVVPALSVAFWTLTWWWAPLEGRGRVLPYALVAFAVLAVLRVLPKHRVSPPLGYTGPEAPPPVTGPTTGDVPRLRSVPSLVVVGAALVLLLPLPLWHHLPGREMAFHTTSARLAAWRDALPATYEPLLPLPHFGSHAPGFPTLAADVSLLSGLDPGRSVVVTALLSAGLLLVGLYALLGTRLRPAAAALGALLGLAAAPWPDFLAVWGEGGPVLALALGLPAAALLIGHSSRSSAVAAGVLLAGAVLAQPLLALVIGVVTAVWVSWAGPGSVIARTNSPGPTPNGEILRRTLNDEAPQDDIRARVTVRRLALAFGVTVVLAGPALARLARALSAREAAGVLEEVQGKELASFVTGLALVGLAAFLARLLTDARPRSRVWTAALVAVSVAILLVSVHAGPAAGQLQPESLRALAGLEAELRPLEAVCAPEGVLDWVPALAGRRPGGRGQEGPQPWVPHPLREEWARRVPRDCSRALDPPVPERSQSLTSGRGTLAARLRSNH